MAFLRPYMVGEDSFCLQSKHDLVYWRSKNTGTLNYTLKSKFEEEKIRSILGEKETSAEGEKIAERRREDGKLAGCCVLG